MDCQNFWNSNIQDFWRVQNYNIYHFYSLVSKKCSENVNSETFVWRTLRGTTMKIFGSGFSQSLPKLAKYCEREFKVFAVRVVRTIWRKKCSLFGFVRSKHRNNEQWLFGIWWTLEKDSCISMFFIHWFLSNNNNSPSIRNYCKLFISPSKLKS